MSQWDVEYTVKDRLAEWWIELSVWWRNHVLRPLEPVRRFFGGERFLDGGIDLKFDEDPRYPCDVCGAMVWDEEDPNGGDHYEWHYPNGRWIAWTRCGEHPLKSGDTVRGGVCEADCEGFCYAGMEDI